MAIVSEIKVTLKDKSCFESEPQTLEMTIHLDDDCPYCSIKTERWDMLNPNGFDAFTNSIFDKFMDAYHLLEKEI